MIVILGALDVLEGVDGNWDVVEGVELEAGSTLEAGKGSRLGRFTTWFVAGRLGEIAGVVVAAATSGLVAPMGDVKGAVAVDALQAGYGHQ